MSATPDIIASTPPLPEIILAPDTYSRFSVLPSYLLKDWSNTHGDPHQQFKSMPLGKVLQEKPEIFRFQTIVAEKIDTILTHIQIYHT